MICPTRKVENFSRPDWTGGIALNRFEKFGFARNAREGVRAPPSVRSSGLTLTIERYGRHEEMLVTVQRRDMTVSLICFLLSVAASAEGRCREDQECRRLGRLARRICGMLPIGAALSPGQFETAK